VGRKWLTTKAVRRWIAGSSAVNAVERAVVNGDQAALTRALKSDRLRVRGMRSAS
jgi:hypothetical protein